MASDQNFLDYVLDHIHDAGDITSRKMFGEYGIYSDGKIFGFICDNKLYMKPTEVGKEYIEDRIEEPIFPGSKNYYLIEDKIEDSEWLSELIRLMVKELPEPKPKKKRSSKHGK